MCLHHGQNNINLGGRYEEFHDFDLKKFIIDWRFSSVLECLPIMWEDMDLIAGMAKKFIIYRVVHRSLIHT